MQFLFNIKRLCYPLFLKCTYVQQFWNDFVHLLKSKCKHCDRLKLNAPLIVFVHDGNTKRDACFYNILLKATFCIYKCRMNKIRPHIQQFMNVLKQIYKVDKHIHSMEMAVEEFNRKWFLYVKLIQ